MGTHVSCEIILPRRSMRTQRTPKSFLSSVCFHMASQMWEEAEQFATKLTRIPGFVGIATTTIIVIIVIVPCHWVWRAECMRLMLSSAEIKQLAILVLRFVRSTAFIVLEWHILERKHRLSDKLILYSKIIQRVLCYWRIYISVSEWLYPFTNRSWITMHSNTTHASLSSLQIKKYPLRYFKGNFETTFYTKLCIQIYLMNKYSKNITTQLL